MRKQYSNPLITISTFEQNEKIAALEVSDTEINVPNGSGNDNFGNIFS